MNGATSSREGLSVGTPGRETKSAEHARSGPLCSIFGRGFDSRRLHPKQSERPSGRSLCLRWTLLLGEFPLPPPSAEPMEPSPCRAPRATSARLGLRLRGCGLLLATVGAGARFACALARLGSLRARRFVDVDVIVVVDGNCVRVKRRRRRQRGRKRRVRAERTTGVRASPPLTSCDAGASPARARATPCAGRRALLA